MKRRTKRMLDYLVTKFSQESSWRGLVGIATAFGAVINQNQAAAIISIGMLVIGCINFGKNK